MPIHFAAEAISKPEPGLMATEITYKMQKYITPYSIPHIRRLHFLMCPNISPPANVLIP